MNLHRIKHSLLRLSKEERLMGVGFLTIILSAFFPWYSTVFLSDERSIVENGFSGDLGVIGFVIFLISVVGVFYLLSENLRFPLPTFGIVKEKIVLFLASESAFLILLSIAVYTKRSFSFTNAEIRFGIYLAFLGAMASTLAGLAALKQREKQETQAFFEHPETASQEPMTELKEDLLKEESEEAEEDDELNISIEKPLMKVADTNRPAEKPRSAQVDMESYAERYHLPPKEPVIKEEEKDTLNAETKSELSETEWEVDEDFKINENNVEMENKEEAEAGKKEKFAIEMTVPLIEKTESNPTESVVAVSSEEPVASAKTSRNSEEGKSKEPSASRFYED